MAKTNASKTAIKVTTGAKRHPPAMYPTPDPVELATPQKLIDVDLKTRTITIEGSPPPELVAAAEMERRRLNLLERIAAYTKTLAIRIAPHWGERPKRISPAKWKNLEQRIKAMAELPENAPAEARDALMALHTLNRMAEELVEAGDWLDSIDRAICYAIDLGQLLQRGQVELDFGATVDRGKRNAKATAGATEANSTKKSDRSELARAEFIRRMAIERSPRVKMKILQNMSNVWNMTAEESRVSGEKRERMWAPNGTLIRWANDW